MRGLGLRQIVAGVLGLQHAGHQVQHAIFFRVDQCLDLANTKDRKPSDEMESSDINICQSWRRKMPMHQVLLVQHRNTMNFHTYMLGKGLLVSSGSRHHAADGHELLLLTVGQGL